MLSRFFRGALIATTMIALPSILISVDSAEAQTISLNQDETNVLPNEIFPETEAESAKLGKAADVSTDVGTDFSTLAGDLLVDGEIGRDWSTYVAQSTSVIEHSLGFVKADFTFAQSTEANSKPSAEAEANNPLANFTAVNFQNYYIGDLTGPAADANQFFLRVAQPFKLFNVKWLGRLTLPVNTLPVSATNINTTTGLGDLNIFTAGLIDLGDPAISFGVGPLITFPTATEPNLGSDKWTIGVANVLFNARSPKFQWGYLITYEHSFAGDSDRATVNRGAFQPFGFYQLGTGWYLRTAPIWAFNFQNGNFNIPLGLGAGKVIKSGKTTYNFFVEPQYTVAFSGDNQPQWQIYFALNMQFGT